jgi:hypothetical protein
MPPPLRRRGRESLEGEPVPTRATRSRQTGEVGGGGREGQGGNAPAPNLDDQVPMEPFVELQKTLRRSEDDGDVPEPLVLTCCNRRGGCGKTTNSAALAMSLAHRGFNVMYADMDPQTDGSQFLLSQKLDALKEPFDAEYEKIKHELMNSNPQMSRDERLAAGDAKAS